MMRRILSKAALRYGVSEHGAAAVEMAIIASMMVVPLLNVMDVGLYMFQRMQVENAAQMAAQATWATCDTAAEQPATTGCANLTTAMTAAAQSTSLGTNVTVGTPTEGYYCLDNANVLVEVGSFPTKPSPFNCTSAPSSVTPSPAPGDYVQVSVSYTYAPLFPAVSVASTFTTPIVASARTRLN